MECMQRMISSTLMLEDSHLVLSLFFAGVRLAKTPGADRFGRQTTVRWTGRARLFAQGEVFKHELTGKMLGTGQNRSFKRGVRLTRVFVRRGSTVITYENNPTEFLYSYFVSRPKAFLLLNESGYFL